MNVTLAFGAISWLVALDVPASTVTVKLAGKLEPVVVFDTVRSPVTGTGLSESPVASQVLSGIGNCSKCQIHCGLTVPALASTANSPSLFMTSLDSCRIMLKGAGGVSMPTTLFAIVTPYASLPAPTAKSPVAAVVGPDPEPKAERWLPNASGVAAATPL